ncbi:hypothetical protein MBLNU230_g6426t1 [Neophaeotheca triangularis]
MAPLKYSTPLLWLVAALATLSQLALVAITARLATTTLNSSRVHGTALAAIVLEIVSLAILLSALAAIVPRVQAENQSLNRPIYKYGAFTGLIITLCAMVTAIYVFAWNQSYEQPRGLSQAGIAIWAIALTLQLSLAVLLAVQWPRKECHIVEETFDHPSSSRSSKRSISVQMTSLTPPPPFYPASPTPQSPTYSTTSSHSPGSSLRQSLQKAVRPVTSKTKLILPGSFSGRETPSMYSREASFDGANQDDDFCSWDTSAVHEFEHPMQQQRVAHRGRLETIPGSRPVSPAKPLDGPFSTPPSPEENQETTLPETPQSPANLAGDSNAPRNDSVATSRRPSTVNDQSHIHPLFRTESPAPPPVPSPGTIVTASPIAGQIFSEEAWGQHRAGSVHGESTHPLSPVRSRASSLKSQRSRPQLDEDVPPVPSTMPPVG